MTETEVADTEVADAEEELDLSTLSDEELVEQMHDDLYDGLREEIEYNPVNWDLVGITAMSTYFPFT